MCIVISRVYSDCTPPTMMTLLNLSDSNPKHRKQDIRNTQQ